MNVNTPIDRYLSKSARYKRFALYLSLLTLGISLFQFLFLLKYLKIIFSFKEASLVDAIIGGLALVNPFIFMGFSVILYFFITRYGEIRALRELFKELSDLKLKRVKDLRDGDYAMISGEVISPSYENPLLNEWVLISHGEIFKVRPKVKGLEEVKLKVYTLPKNVLEEGLRVKDEYGDDFKLVFDKEGIREAMEELVKNGSAKKVELDSVRDQSLVERIAATPFRDVLKVKVSGFELYDTVYLRDRFIPADRRNTLIIGPVFKDSRNNLIIKYIHGKSFARFSSGGLSPVKTLEIFLREYKIKLRKLGSEMKKIILAGILILTFLLFTQTFYVIFLRRMAS